MPADEFVFTARWSDLRGHDAESDKRRSLLVEELRSEVSKGHPLWKADATPLAACGHCDDVIFSLHGGRFAIVHLVWQGRQRAPWPDTRMLDSWTDVEAFVTAHEEL